MEHLGYIEGDVCFTDGDFEFEKSDNRDFSTMINLPFFEGKLIWFTSNGQILKSKADPCCFSGDLTNGSGHHEK